MQMIYDKPIWALIARGCRRTLPALHGGGGRRLVRQPLPQDQGKFRPRPHQGHDRQRPKPSSLPGERQGRPCSTRQPDKTLIPYDPAAYTDADDDEEISEDPGTDADLLPEQSAEFVLEAHLEEFLTGNWKSIRWGRPLEIWTGPDGQSGHQLATPIGRLDFLCTDPSTGALVVVELKRGRPSDKVVGQAARYIGYVRTHLA